MKKPFIIKEIKPRIFFFEFKETYDMCMYFMRYQEFYESPCNKFRGKNFEIFDFMKWYSFKFGKGAFTYPDDWNGFNIPGNIIKDVHNLHINDKNVYDYEMLEAWKECRNKYPDKKFYIIGVVKGNQETLDHEIGHGMFYLDPKYKKEMTALVKGLDPAIRAEANRTLKALGYTSKVYVDEIHAYFSTGLTEFWGDDYVTKWAAERQPFIDCFRRYHKK